MSELTCDCDQELSMVDLPTCDNVDYGFPKFLVFQRTDGTLTCASSDNLPTLAEVQAGLADSGDDKLVLVGPMTNGLKNEAERLEESGPDTIDGQVDVLNQSLEISGKLKFLSEAVRDALEDFNCHDRLRMYYITDKGWWFGQCAGYNVANFVSEWLSDGFGTKSFIPVNYRWIGEGKNPGVLDAGFLTLSNS